MIENNNFHETSDYVKLRWTCITKKNVYNSNSFFYENNKKNKNKSDVTLFSVLFSNYPNVLLLLKFIHGTNIAHYTDIFIRLNVISFEWDLLISVAKSEIVFNFLWDEKKPTTRWNEYSHNNLMLFHVSATCGQYGELLFWAAWAEYSLRSGFLNFIEDATMALFYSSRRWTRISYAA